MFGQIVDKEYLKDNYEKGSLVQKTLYNIIDTGEYIVRDSSGRSSVKQGVLPSTSGQCFAIYKAPKVFKFLSEKLGMNAFDFKVVLVFPVTSEDKITMVPFHDKESKRIRSIINDTEKSFKEKLD